MKQINCRAHFPWAAAALAAIFLTGCNIEELGSSVSEGGVTGTGFIIGPLDIQAANRLVARSLSNEPDTVTVRGRTFDTSDADFTVPDGVVELVAGMLLRVDGSWGSARSGESTRVIYDDTLRGAVSTASLADGSGTLTVLGQTVEITGATRLVDASGTAITAISTGDAVRISGWPTGDGEFRASWVQTMTDDSADAELEGVLGNLDESDKTFTIGNQTIAYDDDTRVLVQLADGLRIEVEGTLNDSGTFDASQIQADDPRRLYRGDDDDDTEIEGPMTNLKVTAGTAGGSFLVNGVEVTWSSLSVFDDELTQDQLRNGLPVEVEGTWRNGKLVAEEIEFGDGLAEVSARITAIDQLERQLTVGGVTVRVPTYARMFDDDTDTSLSLNDLASNDFVEVEGLYQVNENDEPFIEALVIEREDDDDNDNEREITGPVTAKNSANNTFTILGITLTVDAKTEYEGTSFERLSVDDWVEVEYETSDNGNLLAKEVEKEDD